MSHNKILPYFPYTKLYNLKFSCMVELAGGKSQMFKNLLRVLSIKKMKPI